MRHPDARVHDPRRAAWLGVHRARVRRVDERAASERYVERFIELLWSGIGEASQD